MFDGCPRHPSCGYCVDAMHTHIAYPGRLYVGFSCLSPFWASSQMMTTTTRMEHPSGASEDLSRDRHAEVCGV